jgi:hypothetical protein
MSCAFSLSLPHSQSSLSLRLQVRPSSTELEHARRVDQRPLRKNPYWPRNKRRPNFLYWWTFCSIPDSIGRPCFFLWASTDECSGWPHGAPVGPDGLIEFRAAEPGPEPGRLVSALAFGTPLDSERSVRVLKGPLEMLPFPVGGSPVKIQPLEKPLTLIGGAVGPKGTVPSRLAVSSLLRLGNKKGLIKIYQASSPSQSSGELVLGYE